MWGLFYASAFMAALFLYLPGYLFLRALRIARLISVVCAPLVTISSYGVMSIAYAKAGVFCSWSTLFVPVLTVCGALCVIGCIAGRKRGEVLRSSRSAVAVKRDWLCLGLYVTLGVVVARFLLVGNLESPDSYVQDFDNIHHLGVTFGYVESGNWSPFNATLYAMADDAVINPLPDSSFYPAAWNWLAALLVSSLQISVPLAENAVNFMLVSIVLPSSMFLLMRRIFYKTPGIVPYGSVLVLGFSAFPWGFFTFGPLYPNMLAFCMLPSVAYCFMSLFSEGSDRRSRVASVGVFCLGLISFVFAQPNAAFTMGVFLIPFCVYRVALAVDGLSLPQSRQVRVKIGLCALSLALIAAIWYAFYSAPFMQGVVTHSWPAFTTKPQALVDVLTLAFREQGTQVALALLVIVGVLYTIKERRYLWLSCSYAMMVVMYIVDVTSDAPIKYLLTGFWYTDSCRIAASAALFAVPLAAIGLWLASSALKSVLLKVSGMRDKSVSRIAPCVIAGMFFFINMYPNFTITGFASVNTGIGAMSSSLASKNSTQHPRVYDLAEMSFVQEVRSLIPEGSLIINEPDDGSVFAYGTQDLNTYYRYLRVYGEENETRQSKLIRTRLYRIASDEQVRAAVESIGAEYVLVLDQGESKEDRPRLFTYENGKNWLGIELIRDDTPGFEKVLGRGDMRLYRITRCEDVA
ncbi:DUF6541 family protein [Eggerthella sinensis]|uniref:Uncharacterized protein n=3 Tax=Eggerthella sinensis TaxID=242230 RepID=A0A3N0IZW4_9ACTN|nr:DUF6541 family protein [Eggerthella sinensis]RDB70478.1 hypothetical protein C1876_04420 [Eggerthella sinensis]RNM42457.1 hypothetical protein DMP09_04815 [Eggerthella sinensis]